MPGVVCPPQPPQRRPGDLCRRRSVPARGPAGPPATAPAYLPPPGRSKGRGDVDTAVRVREWEETHADLTANTDEAFFHLRLFTDRLDAETAACEIAAA